MSLRLRAVALTVVLIAGLLAVALAWPWISGVPATPATSAAPASASAET